MELQLGANAANVLNHAVFNIPLAATGGTNIDSPSFGRVTNTIIPARVVVLTGRFTF